ncbi:MAG: hypothetical protein ACJ790_13315 [Myxococcaceae bacterium]
MSATPKSRKRTPRKKPAAKVPKIEPVVEATPEPLPVDNEPFEDLTSAPEKALAARVPPPAGDRPRPVRRRAIFIDVENTSRVSRITEALTDLAIDHGDAWTDIIASGNWRVIGNETARLLASRGAQLVHSAPATGVRDWSDLRIAVGAGVWLASARAGDRLDIVSDDRAFDAVGDVASTLGVQYHRHSYRKSHRAEAAAAPVAAEPRTRGPRRRGGRGRRPTERGGSTAAAAPVVAPGDAAASPIESSEVIEAPEFTVESEAPAGPPHAAPVEDLLKVVRDALEKSPQGVSLDALANRLKSLGFQRPPNSPRLVTRLRAIKELEVSDRGFIKLRGEGSAAKASASSSAAEPTSGDPAAKGEQPRRRRRRGGRGRSRSGGGGGAETKPAE